MKYETLIKVMGLSPEDFKTWEDYEKEVLNNTLEMEDIVTNQYIQDFVEIKTPTKIRIVPTHLAYEPINKKNGVDLIKFENGNLGYVNEYGETIEILRGVYILC